MMKQIKKEDQDETSVRLSANTVNEKEKIPSWLQELIKPKETEVISRHIVPSLVTL